MQTTQIYVPLKKKSDKNHEDALGRFFKNQNLVHCNFLNCSENKTEVMVFSSQFITQTFHDPCPSLVPSLDV